MRGFDASKPRRLVGFLTTFIYFSASEMNIAAAHFSDYVNLKGFLYWWLPVGGKKRMPEASRSERLWHRYRFIYWHLYFAVTLHYLSGLLYFCINTSRYYSYFFELSKFRWLNMSAKWRDVSGYHRCVTSGCYLPCHIIISGPPCQHATVSLTLTHYQSLNSSLCWTSLSYLTIVGIKYFSLWVVKIPRELVLKSLIAQATATVSYQCNCKQLHNFSHQ